MASEIFPEQALQSSIPFPGGPDGRRFLQKHSVAAKWAIKTPGGKDPLAPAQLGTRVSRTARSFLPEPEGMAGLQRPFIKMNYEPEGLSGSIWPRLGSQAQRPPACMT